MSDAHKDGASLSLIRLNELAKVYASSYASPHHITFTVEGLRNLIADAVAPVQAPSEELRFWQPTEADGRAIVEYLTAVIDAGAKE
jgi:hypothetical protein